MKKQRTRKRNNNYANYAYRTTEQKVAKAEKEVDRIVSEFSEYITEKELRDFIFTVGTFRRYSKILEYNYDCLYEKAGMGRIFEKGFANSPTRTYIVLPTFEKVVTWTPLIDLVINKELSLEVFKDAISHMYSVIIKDFLDCDNYELMGRNCLSFSLKQAEGSENDIPDRLELVSSILLQINKIPYSLLEALLFTTAEEIEIDTPDKSESRQAYVVIKDQQISDVQLCAKYLQVEKASGGTSSNQDSARESA